MSAERVDALLPLREDVHREKLLQAKALLLCALPYRRIEDPSVTRYARLGRDSRLVVTYTSVLKGCLSPTEPIAPSSPGFRPRPTATAMSPSTR